MIFFFFGLHKPGYTVLYTVGATAKNLGEKTCFLIFFHFLSLLLILCFSIKPMTIFRYVVGPNSYTFCQFEYLLKNVMSMKVPMYISFVSVLRYIFISHSKNPTAIQDDFWALFLEIWTLGIICT